MKKTLLTFLAIIASVTFLSAQTPLKLGYVDSQVILTQLPEAIKAQGDLDALTQRWSNQLDSMTAVYQQGLGDYQKQANNMPDDKKLAAQQDLIKKEQDIVEFRRLKFGQQTGEIYLKQEEIFNPVKEKIYKAIEDVAKEEGMLFVFDKSGDIILLYADSAFDITYKVMDKLKRGNK
ncbi:MAG: molecular chaperone Skp [Ignavibacteria bacterium CG2_30_36_16]|nr:OmpH family outer membrane protein [Ignavibacteria bacterium]OIP63916.1 MAG: molecular chaperone Skp [Ignavibacteria bacterium CG2_30_36_16]PJB01637.1 MAG: molecular chaperone Skp [Ignavibacteria bacterium CG_4_9_14_3_um_filter_36_18]